MTVAVGSTSCSNCSHFDATTMFNWVMPVTFPPGWPRLSTRPNLNRVATHFKNDWNGRGRRLCRKRRRSVGRSDHIHLTMN